MASPTEGFVNVTEGSGKKLHTMNRTVGANDVHDEVMILGEPGMATYAMTHALGGISIATANDHVLEIMAGASLNVYVRRILVYQQTLATTAALGEWAIFILTTAGTGGTATTQGKLDAQDAAAGCTGMTLPTVKGTESSRLWVGTYAIEQTVPTAGNSTLMFDLDFDKLLRGKPIRIAAGTTNGIALKVITGHAAAKVDVVAYVSEANF